MDLIALQLVATPHGPISGEPEHRFGAEPVTIGRSPACQVVLPDPLRLISREHARLVWQGDQVGLTCLSVAAPVQVNGQPVAPGVVVALRSGDLIQVGGFALRLTRLNPPPAPPPSAPPTIEPPKVPDGVVRTGARPPVGHRARLDTFFQLDTPASAEPGPDTHPGHDPEPATEAVHEMPPAAEPDPPPPGDEARLIAAFLAGAGVSPRVGAMAAPLQPLALTPAWMQHLGALLRASVDGTLALLHSRSTVKREMGLEMTGRASRQNNPLKLAPDAPSALMHLVGSKRSATFLEPVAAVQHAHQDLLLHQLAEVAGMRAALFELIARLGPDHIAQDEGPAPTGWRAWRRTRHEAALWRRYRQHHAELTARLDDDFDAVFGREFIQAYEAQSRAFQDGPPPDPLPAPPSPR